MRNSITKHIYKTHVNKSGYVQVCVSLGNRNKKKVFKLHRAVAETFIPNTENKPAVNHLDGNKQNNAVSNLEWATYSENMKHAYDNDLLHAVCGVDNHNSKFSEEDVQYIREHYVPNDKDFGSRALGKRFGVDHMQILRIIHGVRYVNV